MAIDTDEETLRKGDVVLNGYAAEGVNDLHLVVGSTSRKTGPYSTTKYYKTRCLYEGKMQSETLFSKLDNKLTKIGHIDYEGYIKDNMLKIQTEIKGER